MAKTRNTPNLEKLRSEVVEVHAAMQDYMKRTGDTNESTAYKTDARVSKAANAILEDFKYIGTTTANSTMMKGFLAVNHTRMDVEDIQMVACFGHPDKKDFGGLMRAILLSDPEKAPRQTIAYYKLRANAEAVDFIRSRMGRKGSPKSEVQSKIFGAQSFSVMQAGQSKNSDSDRSADVDGTYMGLSSSDYFTMGHLKGMLTAAKSLEEPSKTMMLDMLYKGAENGEVNFFNDHLAAAQKSDEKPLYQQALFELKCAYLRLGDDELPESISDMKQDVIDARNNAHQSSDAVFKLATNMGMSLKQLASLCDVSESRMSQMRGQHQVHYKVAEALGVKGLVAAGALYASPREEINETASPAIISAAPIVVSPPHTHQLRSQFADVGKAEMNHIVKKPTASTFVKLDRTLLDHPQTEYQRSLGFRIAFHQAEREFTDHQLATEVNEKGAQNIQVSPHHVRNWKLGNDLPDTHVMDAIVKVLVDENDAISGVQDKNRTRKALLKAYEKAVVAFEKMGTGEEVAEKEFSAFARKLKVVQKKVGLEDNQELADAINASPILKIPELEQGTLDAVMIARIHANDYKPSNGLAMALVRTLDAHSPAHPISAADKKSLYDLHGENRSQKKFGPATGLPEDLVALKKRLLSYFTDANGDAIPKGDIAKGAGFAAVGVSRLIGDSTSLPSVMRPETLETYSKNFGLLLAHLGKDDATIDAFKADFAQLNEMVRGIRTGNRRADKVAAVHALS